MEGKKTLQIFRTILKILLNVLLILALLLFLAILGINAYLKSNKEKVLKDISILSSLAVTFNEAHIELFKDFPNATLVLHDCTIKDTLLQDGTGTILQIEKLRAELFIKEWRNKIFEINSFHLTNGNLLVHRDTSGHFNIKNILDQFRKPEKNNKTEKKEFLSDLQIKHEHMEVQLDNFSIQLIDSIKTSSIKVHVNSLSTEINIQDNSISSDLAFDVSVPELCFKRKNGSFIKDSHLSGKCKLSYQNNMVSIDPFTLLINEQEFLFNGSIATDDSASHLHFINHNTNLSQILPLLTPNINQTIQPYKILNPFESETTILLTPNQTAKVTVDFALDNNDLLIKNIPFKNTSLQGRFINRQVDQNNAVVYQQGSIRLFLKNVTTQQYGFHVKMDTALIVSDPIRKGRIETKLSVKGKASGLSDWLENENYIFEKGDFELLADIKGPLNNKNKFLLESSAIVTLNDLSFHIKSSDTAIPIESVIIQKKSGDADFKMKSLTYLRGHPYQLFGNIQNINALLLDLETSAKSKVEFRATQLAWEDFIHLFSRRSVHSTASIKTEKETKKSMKETLRSLYSKVEPSALLSIDTFHYYDLITMYNVHSGIQFLNEDILILEKTSFELDQGAVDFQAKLDISNPYASVFDFTLDAKNINLEKVLPQLDYFNLNFLSDWSSYPNDFDFTISLSGEIDDLTGLRPNSAAGNISFNSKLHDDLIGKIVFKPNLKGGTNTTVELEGNPLIFNDLFKNEQYFFQDTGRFHVSFEYDGLIGAFDNLLDQGIIDLTITDGAVHYKEADVIFPLNDLCLQLHEDEADFILYMYSSILDRELNMSGVINNFSELIIGNTGKEINTFVEIVSPKIDVVHAQQIFETPQDSITKSEQEIDDKLKTLINGMTGRFNPRIQLTIDTFNIIQELVLNNFIARATVKDSTNFVIEETTFNFFDSTFELDGLFNLSSLDEAPFEMNLVTRHLDIAKVMKLMNYFDNPSLQNASKIEGSTAMNIVVSGNLNDLELDHTKTKAAIDFYIKDLVLHDVDIIEKMAPKILAKRFFKKINFAPIYNKITLEGKKLTVPQMEIQSTAIDFFVEGFFDYQNETNLWVSVPLDNLKRKPTTIAPNKRGYAATKNKLYFEVTRNEEGKLQRKMRLSKKKYYEQRGIPDQFKLDKKRDKQIRKKNKN